MAMRGGLPLNEIIVGDCIAELARLPEQSVDLVFADPPYEEGWETRLLGELPWEKLLREGGLFCLEWGVTKSEVSELPESAPFLVKIREKIYGDSVLTTYRRTVG
ncbi:MAG: RsmD family RNA methyltransferase [Bdellovibrionota bacterium]